MQSSQAFDMLTYIGDNLNFMIQVLLRNVDQQVVFSIDEVKLICSIDDKDRPNTLFQPNMPDNKEQK